MKSKFDMNKILTIISLCLLVFTSCTDESDEDFMGNWVEYSDFEGIPRSDAVSFVIGNYAYIGTGYDGEDRLKDFWEYDLEKDTWMQKADLPGIARNGAIAFSANQKGYVGTGYDGDYELKDIWEFEPNTNVWTQKSDFPGAARFGAIAFTIYDKGYLGSGYDGNYFKDFWEYDPTNDTWTQKVSIGGGKRRDAVGFVLNDKGYVCTGVNNGMYETDFWEYDPLTDDWTEKRSISDETDDGFDDDYESIIGVNKVAFTIGGKAYLSTAGTSVGSITWEWNPATDVWEEKTELEGSARTEAVAFTIAGRGFVTTGRNSGYYFDDIWELKPNDDEDEDD